MGTQILSIGCYRPDAWAEKKIRDEISVEKTESYMSSFHGSSAIATQTYCKISKESVASMAAEAIHECLSKCNIPTKDIDLIIHVSPILGHLLGEATRVQRAARTKNAAAYQIKGTAYIGTLLAMFQAEALIKTGTYKKILISLVDHVIAGNWEDTGDMAMAMLLSQTDEDNGFIAFCPKIFADSPHSLPLEYAVRDENENYKNKSLPVVPEIKEKEIPAVEDAIQKYGPATMQKSLEIAGLNVSDIHWFIPVNSGERLVKTWKKSLTIPQHLSLDSVAKAERSTIGNIPYTLMRAMEERRFSPGNRILFHGADSGSHLVSAIWRW